MKYSISVVTFTAFEHAKKCVAKVLAHSADFELIVTSQGNPEAARYFTELAGTNPNVRVVVNAENRGFGLPHNHALTLANGDYFVCLNDDLEVQPGWLAILEQPFWEHPRCGLSAPAGGCRTLFPDFHGYWGDRLDYLEASCLMGRTSVLRKIVLFSDWIKFAYCEDSDLSLRMTQAGYTLHEVTFLTPLVHHRAKTSANLPWVAEIAAENRAECVKRWGHVIKLRANPRKILVKRDAAWGDVLLLTPVIRAIKRAFPGWPIFYQGLCGEVFHGNPDVAGNSTEGDFPDPLVIDMNGSYERTPDKPILQCYTETAEKALGIPLAVSREDMSLWADPNELAVARSLFNGDRWVALHTGPSWPSKSWSAIKWFKLAVKLQEAGWKIVLVGHAVEGDYHQIPSTKDRRGKTSVSQLAAILSCCRLAVVIDSFVLHACAARGVPCVALFGCTRAPNIVTAGNVIAVESDPAHPVSGRRHRLPNSVTLTENGDVMETITVERVLKAIQEATR